MRLFYPIIIGRSPMTNIIYEDKLHRIHTANSESIFGFTALNNALQARITIQKSLQSWQ